MKRLFHIFLSLLIVGIALSSCSLFKKSSNDDPTADYSNERKRMETDAQGRLTQARQYLSQGKCKEAKETIEKMRESCPLAIDARYKAILLMDSVDLQQARQELQNADSLLRKNPSNSVKGEFDEACRKVQFYERKLQYDTTSQSPRNDNNNR